MLGVVMDDVVDGTADADVPNMILAAKAQGSEGEGDCDEVLANVVDAVVGEDVIGDAEVAGEGGNEGVHEVIPKAFNVEFKAEDVDALEADAPCD